MFFAGTGGVQSADIQASRRESTASTNYVLIDFENVRPESLGQLEHDTSGCCVRRRRPGQAPVRDRGLVAPLGTRAEYIKVSGNGPNALDFHIAYYIGRLAASDPTAYFHIISKDTGFDPLIRHLKSQKIFAGRVGAIADIPLVKTSNSKSPAAT